MNIDQYQEVVGELARRHYNIELKELPYADGDEAETAMHFGIRPFEALNGYVQEHGLVRLDSASNAPLTQEDEHAVKTHLKSMKPCR